MRGISLDVERHWQTYFTSKTHDSRDWLFSHYLYLVRTTRRRMAPQIQDHEDMEQEGALALLDAIEAFDPNRGVKFTTYAIFHIRARYCKYLTATVGRQQKYPTFSLDHQRWLSIDDADHLVGPDSNSQMEAKGLTPEQQVLFAECRSFVRGCVAKLPDNCREVIERRYWQGKTFREVAEELHRTKPTVFEREQRGLRLLSRHIPPYLFADH
jgi:RNA polymerase sigma factor (sigma-70 family)